jgi:DNA-binding transcriptional LysR family regulator
MLDVTRLRILAAVARYGSVTKAAEALKYAQPSVSHHLARLESETGARIFQRVGRGIRLTEAGRLLAIRAEEILGRLDAAEHELAEHAGLEAGRVRLAAFPSAFSTVVPQIAAEFAARHPGLDLRLVESEPPEALDLLRSGGVDVALVFSHTPEQLTDPTSSAAGIRVTPLFDESLSIVLPPGSRPTDIPRLREYADRSWIAGCERCSTHLLSECAKEGFEPNIAFSTDDFVAVQALVAVGVGVSTLPELALRAHRNPDVVVALLPGSARHVLAATYGEPPEPPSVKALLDILAGAA